MMGQENVGRAGRIRLCSVTTFLFRTVKPFAVSQGKNLVVLVALVTVQVVKRAEALSGISRGITQPAEVSCCPLVLPRPCLG